MTGVDDDCEIRAAAELVGRINRWIRALVEASADCSGEMSACGKADHANLVSIDMPVRGVLAHEAPTCAARPALPSAPLGNNHVRPSSSDPNQARGT
jgi:hypothetical protein